MDRRKFLVAGASAIGLVLLSKGLGSFETFATSSTPQILADRINVTLSAVEDWNDPQSMYGGLANIGLVMNRSTAQDYDSWITRMANNGNWLGVLHVKNFAEHSGYSSDAIDQAVKLALSNMPMLGHSLPAIYTDKDGVLWFHTFYKYALYGFRYSAELNWEAARWNKQAAFEYLARVYDEFGRGFYGMDDYDYAVSEDYGTRWLEVGKIMGCFLIFYQLGIESAMNYALKCWKELNTVFWHNDHYTYSTGVFGYEFSSMDVIPDCYKLELFNPGIGNSPGIANFERLTTDLKNRYLLGWKRGQWSSSNGDQTVTQHLSDDTGTCSENPELRVDGTLNGWILLHISYCLMDSDAKTAFNSMIEGNGGILKASDGLWSSVMRKSNGQFSLRTNKIWMDDGTAQAALCLFLNGISVSQGMGLAIPLVSDWENDFSALNSFHFGFDYQNHIIKVPVWGGTTLSFSFGSSIVSQTFPLTGIYSVSFSSDWNNVLGCTLISSLNSAEYYLRMVKSPMACAGITNPSANPQKVCVKSESDDPVST